MRFIVGIDEAGRGPLAGPVSVGAVRAPENFDIAAEFPGITDSKKLSEKKREGFFEQLELRAAQGDLSFTVELEPAETIDTKGIVPAVHLALERTLLKLKVDSATTHVKLDGSLHAPKAYRQETIVHGDALVPVISLASVAAKVVRDRLLIELSETYPEYGFEKHKGYGTKAHYEALTRLGPCEIHRRSFLKLS